jgi:hypothetical protein
MCRPREPGRPGAAKLLGDDRNLAGPHTLNNHIHLLQRQHTGLHTALVAAEDICLETAIPCLRNSQLNNPRTGVKRARPVAVPVDLPFIRAFVLVSPKAIRHLRLQNLVRNRLDQLRRATLAAQKAWQGSLPTLASL